jgi:hypothetical protein
MHEALRLLFPGSFLLAAIIAVSFMAWFALRDRPLWDTALFATASAAMAILALGVYLLGPLAVALAFTTLPSLILYLWFWALRRARRLHAAIRRWGGQSGHAIIRLERTVVVTSLQRPCTEYLLTARRRSDGRIRTGRVLTDRSTLKQGFEVVWDAED